MRTDAGASVGLGPWSGRRSELRGRLLTTLLALLGMALPATAAATPPADYVGANVQPLFEKQIVPRERWDDYAARLAADGLRVVRLDAIWAWAEPDPPANGAHTYRWNRAGRSLDEIVALFARHRIRIAAVIALAPGWAGNQSTDVTPQRYPDLAAFAAAFAARYGGRGTFWNDHPALPRTPIRDYELWTEANSSNFWTHAPNPAEYLKALRLFAPAVRAADPGAPVLVDIGWQNFEAYVGALYAGGLKGLVDGVGFNPYAPHAPAILDLVRRMRALLVKHGDGALPIHILEIGQPAVRTGGASTATRGAVSDAARAATHSLTADALARSDCGVEDYLLYAVVGSETDREPIGEGFMGIYRPADATPNLTGRAMADVAARWRANPTTGVALCARGTSPERMLPLDAVIAGDGGRCVAADVRYRGYPLEGARLRLSAGTSGAEGESDAFGKARACLPAGAPAQATANVAITDVARSATYECALNASRCAPSLTCSHRIKLRLTRVSRKLARATATLTCGAEARPRLRFRVYVRRRSGALTRRLRTVTVPYRKPTAFSVRARLRPGDRLVVVAGPDAQRAIPRLKATAQATRRLGAR